MVESILSSLPPEEIGEEDILTIPPPPPLPDYPDASPTLEILEERTPLQIGLQDGSVIILDDDGYPD